MIHMAGNFLAGIGIALTAGGFPEKEETVIV